MYSAMVSGSGGGPGAVDPGDGVGGLDLFAEVLGGALRGAGEPGVDGRGLGHPRDELRRGEPDRACVEGGGDGGPCHRQRRDLGRDPGGVFGPALAAPESLEGVGAERREPELHEAPAVVHRSEPVTEGEPQRADAAGQRDELAVGPLEPRPGLAAAPAHRAGVVVAALVVPVHEPLYTTGVCAPSQRPCQPISALRATPENDFPGSIP
jgi:hypothetical protein